MPSSTPRQPRLDYGPEDTMRELSTLIMQMASRANERQHEKDLIELRSQEAMEQTIIDQKVSNLMSGVGWDLESTQTPAEFESLFETVRK